MSDIVMDGLAEWKGPVVQVGDSLGECTTVIVAQCVSQFCPISLRLISHLLSVAFPTPVFRHKGHLQNLYLFHNRRAFDLCSFSQATLIYDGSKSTHFTVLSIYSYLSNVEFRKKPMVKI